eukprot:gene30013-18089_t
MVTLTRCRVGGADGKLTGEDPEPEFSEWLLSQGIKSEQDGVIRKGEYTCEALYWAFGVLLSRLITLPGKSGEQALVPFADFLNHEAAVSTHLDWDASLGAVVIELDRPYNTGEQIYVSYGPKSSGELLLSYGFCPAPEGNQHEELVAYMAFAAAQPKEQEEVGELCTFIFEQGIIPVLDDTDLELVALRELAAECTRYPTSMEQDRAQASGANTPDGTAAKPLSLNKQKEVLAVQCASIRLRERQILQRCSFFASSRIKELSRNK